MLSTQHGQQILKITRRIRLDVYRFAANRVSERQFLCMQGLPTERPQYVYYFFACARRQRQPSTISLIADQGVAAVRKVNPYLVGPSCFKLYSYIRVRIETLQEPIVRYGLLAGVGHVHSQAIHRMTPNGCIYLAAAGQNTNANRQVFP
jgi:hypothetical protein